MSTSNTASSGYTYGDPHTTPILCECMFEVSLRTSWILSNLGIRFQTCSGLRIRNHVVYFILYVNCYIVAEYLTMQCLNSSNFLLYFRVISVVSLSSMIK